MSSLSWRSLWDVVGGEDGGGGGGGGGDWRGYRDRIRREKEHLKAL